MPTSPRQNVMCRYYYDATDRSIEQRPANQPGLQRFYCNNRLSSENQGMVQRSIFQHNSQLLAQQHHRGDKVDTALLATDQQRSVLNVLDAAQPNPLAYTAFGHCPPENGLTSLLGFNGEVPDQVTRHYHLGNGYRQFNPVLMRFNSPDSWSPFGKGGLNTYGYCGGDPINRSDPSGHYFLNLLSGGLIVAGAVTAIVGVLAKNDTVKIVGAAILGTGGVIFGISMLRSPRLFNMHRLTSSPAPQTSPSPSPPNSPTPPTRPEVTQREGQSSLNGLNKDVQSTRPAPVTSTPLKNSSIARERSSIRSTGLTKSK